MNSSFKEWLAITSNIAILIGILLVFWELQQARTLAQVQLRSDNAALSAQLSGSLMGDSPERILTKACLQPDDLTTEEKIVMSQIFQNRLAIASMQRGTARIGDFGDSYQYNFRTAFQAIFNYEYGKDFFERMKEFVGEQSDIATIGEEVLASHRPSDCAVGTAIPSGF